ncbi:hypothetical protein GCM10017673_53360 [Streptosporangium violaceochromogenes]|nr:hypothetical protein GCM10017673_53360 [Streptosporangium violaceochromogenes]
MLFRMKKRVQRPIFGRRAAALSLAALAGALVMSPGPAPAGAATGSARHTAASPAAGALPAFLFCVGTDGCRWRFCGRWGYHRHCNVFVPRHERRRCFPECRRRP